MDWPVRCVDRYSLVCYWPLRLCQWKLLLAKGCVTWADSRASAVSRPWASHLFTMSKFHFHPLKSWHGGNLPLPMGLPAPFVRQETSVHFSEREVPVGAVWVSVCVCVCVCVCGQSCPTLCDPMDCSPPGSSVRGLLQARILEWVTIPISRGSSWPRDWTSVSHTAARFFTVWASREVL